MRLHIYIPDDVYEQARRIARQQDRSVSYVVSKRLAEWVALEDYKHLKEYEEIAKDGNKSKRRR